MKTKKLLVLLFILLTLLESFQCGRDRYSNCANFKNDTLLFNCKIPVASAVYHIGDTIMLESMISDNFTPLSGNPSFTRELNQLNFNVQPFVVKNTNTLPELQYANVEFNPFVREGQLQNIGIGGYVFLYKRLTALNSLKIGLIAGRSGLYVLQCRNSQYSYDNDITIYNQADACTTYRGVTNFLPAEQNRNYWDSVGVTALSLAPNYGNTTIAKSMRNYFFFKVVP